MADSGPEVGEPGPVEAIGYQNWADTPKPGTPCSTRKDGKIDGIIGEDGKCHKALGGDTITIRGGDQDTRTIIVFFGPRDLLTWTGNIGGRRGGGGGNIDDLQKILDIIGTCPIVGEWADGANALISIDRENYGDALASGIAIAPVVGWGGNLLQVGGERSEWPG